MGGGGGGSIDTSSLTRNFGGEWPSIRRGYGHQIDQFNSFVGGDPILSRLYPAAAHDFGMGPSSILRALTGQGLDYLKRGPSAVTRSLLGLATNTVNAGPSAL